MTHYQINHSVAAMQNNRPSNFSRGKVEKTCSYAA